MQGRLSAVAAAPPPLPQRPSALASDRKLLLQYVLETRGLGAGLDGVLLDCVDVPALVAALRAGKAFTLAPGKVVPAAAAAAPAQAAPPAHAPAVLPAAPVPLFARGAGRASRTAATPAREASDAESSRSTSTSSSDDDDDDDDERASAASPAAPAAAAVAPAPLELALACLTSDLEDEAAHAAFQLHAAACALADGSVSGKDPMQEFLRAQLGASPALAAHLWGALATWRQGAASDGAGALSLRLPAALLANTEGLGPKDARRWQRVQLSQLLAALPGPSTEALRTELYAASLSADASVAQPRLLAIMEARGWSVPAEPLGCLLYSTLLRAQWDDLDESSGEPVEEAADLLESLRRVWMPLGISETAHTAHCVFSAVQRWVLGGSVDALKTARDLAAGLRASLAQPRTLEAVEAAHLRVTLAAVAARASLLLEDYHATCSQLEGEAFVAWLELARDVRAALASSKVASAPAVTIGETICKSLAAAYSRCCQLAAPQGINSRAMSAVAKGVEEVVQAEMLRFTPRLERCEPAAACIAAAHLQKLFARDLLAWLPSAGSLEDALPGLKAAESLVARLQSFAIGGAAGDPPPPVDVAALAEPVAMGWVTSRLAQMRQWMERGLKLERWQVDTSSQSTAAASAVDLIRSANEATDAFFGLRLHQSTPARALAQGIIATLEGYATTLVQMLGDPAKHVPPAPPLTRYKQAAVELLAQEHAHAPDAAAPAEQPAPLGLTVDNLLVMFASLSFMVRELPATEHSIQRHWVALSHQPVTLRRGQQDVAPLTRLFSGVNVKLQEARRHVLAHAGNIVVFHHLKHPFLDRTYVFGTRADTSRLPVTLLEPLNPWMECVCGAMGDDDRNEAAGAMLAAVCRGLRRVLLDGGPERTFLQDDCDALEADLAAVRDFFVADGDGMSPEQVHEALVPMSRLLDAMAQDTHHLIALYERQAAMWDKDTLLRVLCHRADRTSSKYLKKTLHTPKAIGFIEEKRHALEHALRLRKA